MTCGGKLADPLPPPVARTLVVFKDAHLLPPQRLPEFEELLRRLAGGGARCVCAVALPLPVPVRAAFGESLGRLRRAGLACHVNLRPLPRHELPALVASLIGAVPEPALTDRLWAMTRGWPVVTATALRTGQDNDLVRVVDRHAYLTPWRGYAKFPEDDALLAPIHRLGRTAWEAAKAAAVLCPLGPALPRLVGEALDVPEAEAAGLLGALVGAGVLRRRAASASWRFRLPFVAVVLRSTLLPFERCRLAALAVHALWAGTAHCRSGDYLADMVADAVPLVDRDRARAELLARAGAPRDAGRRLPWLRAAAELAPDPAERAKILVSHARLCLAHGEAGLAVRSTDLVLRSCADAMPEDALCTVVVTHLTALHESGDSATLERIADERWWPWPGAAFEDAARAVAWSLLGRWREAHEPLASIAPDPAGRLRTIGSVAGLWLGAATGFDDEVRALRAGEVAPDHVGALLVLAEADRAEALLALGPVPLTTAEQAARAFYAGRMDEGLELARTSIATGPPTGCAPDRTVVVHLAAVVQVARGKLARARELVATARARRPALPHLLAVAEAAYEGLLGDVPRGRAIVEAALAQTEADGIVAQTDALWMTLADLAVHCGETGLLPGYLAKVANVASRMGTGRAEIHRLVLQAVVHADPAAAAAALALLRRRGQPLESIIGLERLVRYGIGDPALLSEAYALAGDMDALVTRSRLRTLMRDRGVPVPGRQATVAENERLLAVLVAEGLSNRQIATLLQTSEKSVAGRLSRLFSHAGYRSRVELVTAVLTGRFQA